MYAEFDTPEPSPATRRDRHLIAFGIGAAVVSTVLFVITLTVLAPGIHAQQRGIDCPSTTSPAGVVTGSGPGDFSNGPAAILGFNHAYYVQRSAEQARRFLTADALVGPSGKLQAGIDAVPADTYHCVTISPLERIGDADLWAVTVTEYHPDSEPYAPRQIITTRTVGELTLISSIARA
ncbi:MULTISPECIES: hypothetical protein [Nocardia]|uniref:DUF8176 domain-containing protein n=1 Tax=Nocardia asteroides NBRC 15531 TaxID=1110697 RepID=U5EAE6_NOCAS|nr:MULTISPECIES: hypothetical protein [Nocardia]TLF63369.1 hypothetical protein FEK33_25375 [Nocardia asteroides NBRC 15531]UGT47203.1 hypothetical protein LT345_22145 [Nocardia asteroides]SFM76493.1 hypothetical protein SAMN05444423_104145 [Nocardia asteroides]VEG33913.1 Uncharacterised protein [Nocardia asteroides]GAD87072.1 hypothetical protein NCAST_34_02000 [Nocardia asteroides NBRC 15531]